MTSNAILELGPEQTEKTVTTRHLWLASYEGRRVPGLLLTPADAEGPRPVVLLGHGAGGAKDDPQMLSIARWLVRREGWAVTILDGPVHGERRPENASASIAYEAMARRETFTAMAADWRAAVDACGELPDVGNERIAYLGFSMGTMLGLPTVAAEPRIGCAVFAIGGINDENDAFFTKTAGQIARPVLMINQSDDELFTREGTFRLYDALPGPKRLLFHPGLHSAVPREAMEYVRDFLRTNLTGEGVPAAATPAGAH